MKGGDGMYKYIWCMGKSRRDILEDLDNKSTELVLHLVKIILFRTRGNLKHWCDELYGFVPAVDRLKGSNKYPSADFIYRALWNGPSKNLLRTIVAVKNSYDYKPYKVSTEVVSNYIQLYLQWASEELSQHGRLPGKKGCSDKAMEILNEFES